MLMLRLCRLSFKFSLSDFCVSPPTHTLMFSFASNGCKVKCVDVFPLVDPQVITALVVSGQNKLCIPTLLMISVCG